MNVVGYAPFSETPLPMAAKKQVGTTLQDIADRTGYGRSTVSLALRNHPSLPEETRVKIREAAESLGYRPNPLVAALMTQLRDRRRTRQERIALVSRFGQTMTQRRRTDTFYPVLYDAIQQHAATQGFGMDEFYMGKDPMPDARLTQILVSRGIHGVLFFPGSDRAEVEYPALDWRHFATVLIGFNTTRENLHQVASDYTYDIDHALQRVATAGLRRIGCVVTQRVSRATNHAWASRFLLKQHGIPAAHRVPLLMMKEEQYDAEEVLAWFRRHRPEVILVAGDSVRNILVADGVRVPGDVRLINLVQRGEKGMSGIDPHTGEVGRAAVDLLASLLRSNQLGQPDFPRTIAIKGHWSPGASFPE